MGARPPPKFLHILILLILLLPLQREFQGAQKGLNAKKQMGVSEHLLPAATQARCFYLTPL